MKLKQLGFLLLTTSILTYAGNTNVYDLDIGGVKLGMNPDEAIKNLKSKYATTKKNLRLLKSSSEFYNNYKTKYISYTSLNMKNMNIQIQYGVTPPLNKEVPVQVESIVYTIEKSEKNNLLLEQMALKKYGEADSIHKKGYGPAFDTYEWCKTPLPLDKYETLDEYPKGVKCGEKQAKLILQGNKIKASNPLCHLKRLDARKQAKTVTPSF